ncbi:hypothetical protein AXF42_Ash010714 [Apostasia shenzhenica]|uniref:Uncharacterized protein n=1 Tax=Apostasia shenzhenica TaxID=1088818 RepID=A0A2I0A6V5_9ASPA|nr:hypothetical protein AXF42_Ash010714 [Apostasia shenzhenica]
MGGVDDTEPPLKRVKGLSVDLDNHLNNSTLLRPVIPLGGPMARPFRSQGKEDMVGTKGVIRKVEFVRIIAKTLYSLGYEQSGKALEEESGIYLHSPVVSLFRKQLLDGNWDGSVETLRKIGLDEHILSSASFLILEYKFFDLLKRDRVMDALKTLRCEIAPIEINKKRVHELSSCIISSSKLALIGIANLCIDNGKLQLKLLDDLQKLLPPAVLVPERRLENLVEQALNVQREACFFHNSLDNALSLYSDHQCGKDQLPSKALQVLEGHKDEVWFVQFSHNGKYLASSSNDKSVIVWEVTSFF